MKITLIGASGFVGTRLITLLKKAQRYEMLNIDLQQSRFFPEVTAIGDVRDQDYLDKKLEGAECVVLLAAQHRDDVVPVSLYYDTNVGGIEKTLKAMYNPQIQISAESETKRSIFREKDKTKRSKKESAQHSKSRNKSFVMTSVSAL